MADPGTRPRTRTDANRVVPDLPLWLVIALHLVPGAAVASFYLLAAPAVLRLGFPRDLSLLIGFTVVGMPVQLGIMAAGARMVGRPVVRYRERLPLWQYVAAVSALLVVVAALLQIPLGGIARRLADAVSFLPAALRPGPDAALAGLARGPVLATLVSQLIVDGLVNPIIEETYFRGFLLAQLERLAWVAPVLNTALFALGHFWQLYNSPSIFLYVLPLTAFTFWKRNYYPQAALHCLGNTVGAVSALVTFAGGAR